MSAIGLEAGLTRPAAPLGALGRAGLSMIVIASAWIAVGAASATSAYDPLQLPISVVPSWVHGPLRGLGLSLSPSGLSVALMLAGAGYLLALAGSRYLPMRLVLGAVAGATFAFTLAPSIVSSDVFGYLAYARETVHGLNPYVHPPVALAADPVLPFVFWKHQPSPYGPLFTLLSLPAGLLPPAVALWSVKAVMGLVAMALAVLVGRLAAQRGVCPARAVIFVSLNPLLLVYGVSGAHNDLLAAALLVLSLIWVIGGRERAGGAVAVASVAVKVTLGLALPFVLLLAARRRRALSGVLLGAVVIALPTAVLFGGHVADQVHRIATDPLFDTAFSGPDRLGGLFGTSISTTVRALSTGAAMLVAAVVIGRSWRFGLDPVVAAGWAFLALLASIASLAPWYLVWLLPLAAVSRSRRLTIATLLACAYVLAVHVPALGGQLWLSPAQTTPAGAP